MEETALVAPVAPPQTEAPHVVAEASPPHGSDGHSNSTTPDAVQNLPSATLATAREQLGVLANPTDSLNELGATKDQINALLEEGSQFLLDAKDSRILVTALARQAGATPLGIELRKNALIMLRDHPPEEGNMRRHEALKTAIGAIVPNNTSENSTEFLSFLEGEQANLKGPDQKKMKPILEALRGGDLNAFQVMALYLNRPDEQAASIRNHLWEAIGGEREKPLNLRSSDNILKAANLKASLRNKAKLRSAMTERQSKDSSRVMMGIEIGMLSFMLFNQLVTEGEGGGKAQPR